VNSNRETLKYQTQQCNSDDEKLNATIGNMQLPLILRKACGVVSSILITEYRAAE
jgi:hypothetical protein